jgi:hypothetical protein
MFSISSKVVLVDDTPHPRLDKTPQPHVPKGNTWCKKGGVYVVRDSWASPIDGLHLIQLTGVPEYYTMDGHRVGFRADRFRKLEDVKAENALRSTKFSANPQ